MSASGHLQKSIRPTAASALPPKADIRQARRRVRKVPRADCQGPYPESDGNGTTNKSFGAPSFRSTALGGSTLPIQKIDLIEGATRLVEEQHQSQAIG